MIHIAVLLRQYLDCVLDGTKTVECRLTRDARAPFECIEAGERIYFKQSAGPYRATAIAEHVLCESNLTPRRVRQLRRDYNDLLCGEDWFWKAKSNARYCTLIWLTEVRPTDTGPHLRPLRGVAWVALEEEPAWRRSDQRDPSLLPVEPNGSFAVTLTHGNLRNDSVCVRPVIDRFPMWCLGGNTKNDAARQITLLLHEGPTTTTDIVASKGVMRVRGVWRTWFARHGARAGDAIVFTPMDEATYFVGLLRLT